MWVSQQLQTSANASPSYTLRRSRTTSGRAALCPSWTSSTCRPCSTGPGRRTRWWRSTPPGAAFARCVVTVGFGLGWVPDGWGQRVGESSACKCMHPPTHPTAGHGGQLLPAGCTSNRLTPTHSPTHPPSHPLDTGHGGRLLPAGRGAGGYPRQRGQVPGACLQASLLAALPPAAATGWAG